MKWNVKYDELDIKMKQFNLVGFKKLLIEFALWVSEKNLHGIKKKHAGTFRNCTSTDDF